MDRNNFNKDIFFNYLTTGKLKEDDIAYLIRMYKTYVLVDKMIKDNPENSKNYLLQLEEDIYTVNNKKIPIIKRIELELNNISKVFEENKTKYNSSKIENVEKELISVRNIFNSIELDNVDESLLEYIKKRISILQSMVGINNTFLESTYNAFLEKYRNMCIDKSNDKVKEEVINENDFMTKLRNYSMDVDRNRGRK